MSEKIDTELSLPFLKQSLQEGQVRVKFTKVNGDVRDMVCTTNLNEIPEEAHPKDSGKTKSDEVFCVYDVANEGWRSFRIDAIIDWNPL